MKKAIFFVALFFIAGTLQAQLGDSLQVVLTPEGDVLLESQLEQTTADPSTLPATREYAAEKIEVRKFDEKRWREVVGSQQYNDTRKRQTPLERRRGEEARSGTDVRESDSDDDTGYDDESSVIYLGWLGPIARLIFYGLIIAIIVTILYQIARHVSLRSNPKKNANATKSPDEVHDITELDTETLLNNAHASGNYKLAIRLYFLHLLKRLNENGSIAWTKDKTNRDYLSELFSKQYYFDEVRRLTLAYERVWYGEHVPTAETYQELSSEFRAIDQKLNSAGRS